MNLNARERQALRSIEGGLTESDPELVAKFATLFRLMAPKDRPAAERSPDQLLIAGVPVCRRHVAIGSFARSMPRSRRHGHTRAHQRWGSAVLALWLAVSCALIATAAAFSHGGPARTCGILVVHCDSQTPASPAGAR